MHATHARLAAAAAIGWMAMTSAAAFAGGHAITVRTPSLVPDPGGYLNCKVVATGAAPIGIVAHVIAADGGDVTDFGTSFRASPSATADGKYYAEETAGSLADTARSCRAEVTGARRSDITITLQAVDAAGNPGATVVGR